MKAIKYEIYVPAALRQAVLQYLQGHVLMFFVETNGLCVIIAEKSKEFEAALDDAIAYVKANTSRGFVAVATPCTIIKE